MQMKIGDLVSGGQIRTRAIVMQQKTGRPVQFELLPDARASLLAWLERRGGTVDDYVFPSRVDHNGHLSTRKYARLIDEWATGVGLMRSEYGTHSLWRTTRVIAGTLQRALGADLFEIRPARPYPEDYEQHVAQTTRERDSGFEPSLAGKVDNIGAYGTVFLGFPIWGETAPPPIRSFLKAHDLRGKTLRPFITHGGYGVGSSPAVLASHAAGAAIQEPFVMEADQERRTLNQVRDWLGKTDS